MSQFIDQCHEGGIGIETIFRRLLYTDGTNYYINFLDSGLSESEVQNISDCEDVRSIEQLFRLSIVEDLGGDPAIHTVFISEGSQCIDNCEQLGTESILRNCFYTDGINIYLGIKQECNLLLNQYPASVSGYSFNLINCEYENALVKIRRSSDSAQKDFYPDSNNTLSLNSTDGAGTTLGDWIGANDGYVVTWYDQKGINNWTQATALQQPLIVSAGVIVTSNGVTAMQLIPSDTMETLAGFSFGLNDFSYLINYSSNVPASEGYVVGVASVGSPGGVGVTMSKAQEDLRSRPFGVVTAYTTSNLNDGVNHITTNTLDRDGDSIIYSDGAPDLTQDISGSVATALSGNQWCLGAENCAASFFTGYVMDIILFNGVLTQDEITDINSQL